tara:strand:+ start:645 stop:839 length:195 start_codon:yes stop_codon:yes gene_type:complete
MATDITDHEKNFESSSTEKGMQIEYHYRDPAMEEFGPLDIYDELEEVQKKIELLTKKIQKDGTT